MAVHVVTTCNKSAGYFEILKESCIRNETNLKVLGFGEKWGGFTWKFEKLHQFLKTIDLDDIVVCTDGFDVVMLEHVDEMMLRYKKFDRDFVVGVSYPITGVKFATNRIFGTYTRGNQTYNICAGLYMGTCRSLKHIVDYIIHNYDLKKINDDQLLMTRFFNDNRDFTEKYVGFDSEFSLFANASVKTVGDLVFANNSNVNLKCIDGKLITQFGTQPVFLHGPGNLNLKKFIEYIGYKNVPTIEPPNAGRVKFYTGLLFTGLLWSDYAIFLIVLVISILMIILVVKGIKHTTRQKFRSNDQKPGHRPRYS